jgi:putative membrane protein
MKPSIQVLAIGLAAFAWSAQADTPPTDPQIASIVVTANQVDIDAGKLAEAMGSTPEVKAFGKRMVVDHTAVNKSASDLVKKLKVTPEPSDASADLKKDGDEAMAKLKGLQGAEFDRAYIDNEVKYHQAVIDTVDDTLIPNAKNAELKALLVKVRPQLVSHLEHAKQMQAKMEK